MSNFLLLSSAMVQSAPDNDLDNFVVLGVTERVNDFDTAGVAI